MVQANQLNDLLFETESVVSVAEGHGRTDKRFEYNLIKERIEDYIKLRDQKSYSAIYGEIVEQRLLNVLKEFRELLFEINSRFEVLGDIKSRLLSDFSLVEKSTMAYSHLKYLIELMELYAKFDRFKAFDRLSESAQEVQKVIRKASVVQKERYIYKYNVLEKAVSEKLNPTHTEHLIDKLESLSPDAFDENNPTEMYKKLDFLDWEVKELIEDENKRVFQEQLNVSLQKRIHEVKSLTT